MPWICDQCYYKHPDPVDDPFYQSTVKQLMYFCAIILVFVSRSSPSFSTLIVPFSVLFDRIVVFSSHARVANLAESSTIDAA